MKKTTRPGGQWPATGPTARYNGDKLARAAAYGLLALAALHAAKHFLKAFAGVARAARDCKRAVKG